MDAETKETDVGTVEEERNDAEDLREILVKNVR